MTVTANLLPNGKQQFLDGNGKPLASGKVYFYIPTTTTFKNTWQDPERVSLNTNPVQLDLNGEAVIFGDGIYRQVVKDVNGVEIWDEYSIQFVTVGGDLSGELPNPTVNPTLFIDQFNTNKNPPVDNDRFLALDSAAALAPIYFLWSQIKTAMQTALEAVFDLRYAQSTNVGLGYSNLQVNVTSNTQVAISVSKVVAFTSAQAAIVGNNLAVSADISTSGVNGLDTGAEAASTWYNVWLIYNPTTLTWASLLSLSATAPTMPSGYTYKVRVGVVRNDSGSNLLRTLQKGDKAQYVVGTNPTIAPVAANGVIGTHDGTSPVLNSVSLIGFVPPTAGGVTMNFAAKWKGNTASKVLAAPNVNWGGTNNGPVGSNGQVWPLNLDTSSDNFGLSVEWVLEALSFGMASDNAGAAVSVLGWIDQL